mmetsp:Transcript_90161/g.255550  ORF Transcript_90161/g.255550 Transcript_90161/m.255550 type:complete len:261 (+) Transcript_90161:467-1249(+)
MQDRHRLVPPRDGHVPADAPAVPRERGVEGLQVVHREAPVAVVEAAEGVRAPPGQRGRGVPAALDQGGPLAPALGRRVEDHHLRARVVVRAAVAPERVDLPAVGEGAEVGRGERHQPRQGGPLARLGVEDVDLLDDAVVDPGAPEDEHPAPDRRRGVPVAAPRGLGEGLVAVRQGQVLQGVLGDARAEVHAGARAPLLVVVAAPHEVDRVAHRRRRQVAARRGHRALRTPDVRELLVADLEGSGSAGVREECEQRCHRFG